MDDCGPGRSAGALTSFRRDEFPDANDNRKPSNGVERKGRLRLFENMSVVGTIRRQPVSTWKALNIREIAGNLRSWTPCASGPDRIMLLIQKLMLVSAIKMAGKFVLGRLDLSALDGIANRQAKRKRARAAQLGRFAPYLPPTFMRPSQFRARSLWPHRRRCKGWRSRA